MVLRPLCRNHHSVFVALFSLTPWGSGVGASDGAACILQDGDSFQVFLYPCDGILYFFNILGDLLKLLDIFSIEYIQFLIDTLLGDSCWTCCVYSCPFEFLL